jgi:hypothetical protein
VLVDCEGARILYTRKTPTALATRRINGDSNRIPCRARSGYASEVLLEPRATFRIDIVTRIRSARIHSQPIHRTLHAQCPAVRDIDGKERQRPGDLHSRSSARFHTDSSLSCSAGFSYGRD